MSFENICNSVSDTITGPACTAVACCHTIEEKKTQVEVSENKGVLCSLPNF